MLTPLKRYATFSGRAARAEFWPYVIASTLLQTVLLLVLPPLGALVGLALFIPSTAVTVRRLHDVNRRGLWLLPLPILSILGPMVFLLGNSLFGLLILGLFDPHISEGEAGTIVWATTGVIAATFALNLVAFLVFMAKPGTAGPNRFGEPPAPPKT